MYIAKSSSGERITASRNVEAFCPGCNRRVIAKIGRIITPHWAHQEKCGCDHGKGMTQWHYKWIQRHHDNADWEVEYISDQFRFDCFNKSRNLVIEIQKKPMYEYCVNKTQYVLSKGYSLYWIFHEEVMSALEKNVRTYDAKSRRRLVILDVLEMFSSYQNVQFFVDTHALGSNGNSIKGLVHLKPLSNDISRYSDYYRIPYEEYKT